MRATITDVAAVNRYNSPIIYKNAALFWEPTLHIMMHYKYASVVVEAKRFCSVPTFFFILFI